MYVGICDDDLKIQKQIQGFLKSRNWPIPVETDNFVSLDELSKKYQTLDVLFLDIEVGQENSLDFLAMQPQRQTNPIIILVSSHSSYITRSYQVSVFQFLLKPLQIDLLTCVFLSCCKQYLRFNQYCIVKMESAIERRLFLHQILCIKSQHHQLVYYDLLLNRYYGTNLSLAAVLHRLQPFGFCQVHKSYLLNLDFVHSFEEDYVVLQGKENVVRIPIGPKYKSSIREEHLRYLAMKGNEGFGDAFHQYF